jgi:predicted house-cleaning noncanonical NTP pyrophosphatase (MazG superfamily)
MVAKAHQSVNVLMLDNFTIHVIIRDNFRAALGITAMAYKQRLSLWAVIRLLPNMQREIVARFRSESDADGHLKVLRRLNPGSTFQVVFDLQSDSSSSDGGVMARRVKASELVKSMKIRPNELVRDLVPNLLRGDKFRCEAVSMQPSEYLAKLKLLLIKQAQTVADAFPYDFCAEAAELYDLLDALVIANHQTQEAIQYKRDWLHENMGGFEERLKLLWIEPE